MSRAGYTLFLLILFRFHTSLTSMVPNVDVSLDRARSLGLEQFGATVSPVVAIPREVSETEKIVPALKRFHTIGSLYNDCKDDFVSYGIITGKLPMTALRCSKDFETYFEETLVRSSSDRLRVLGFDLNVQASILSGLAEVTFDGSVQTKKVSDSSHAVALIDRSAKTFAETLDLGSPSLLAHLTVNRVRSSPANNVVSGVIYGFRYEIWLEQSLRSSNSTSEFGADVAGQLKKVTKLVTGSLRGRGKHQTRETTDGKDVQMTVLGGVSLPTTGVTTYDELIDFAILNISTPNLRLASLVEENMLQETVVRFDAAETAMIRLEEIRAKVSSLACCLVSLATQKVVELVESYKVALFDYRDTSKTAILKERQGLVGETFALHDKGPTGLKRTLENVTIELQNYADTITTYKHLHMNNITCMPSEIGKRDVVLRYWNYDVLLLIFKSDSVHDHLPLWNRRVTDMIRVCSLKNMLCHFVDCQFEHPYCSGEIVPEVRAFVGGIRVHFRHILDYAD